MKTQKKIVENKQDTLKAIVNLLATKKEIKSRFQKGERLREITKEKGLEIVLPL